jgi:hypothetical protein
VVPVRGPLVAMMVALPIPTAVSVPEVSTVATVVSELDHVTGAFSISTPVPVRTNVRSTDLRPGASVGDWL